MDFATAMDSMKPTNEMVSAAGRSATSVAVPAAGTANPGKPPGTAPTMPTPDWSRRNAKVRSVPPATTRSGPGSLGAMRRTATSTTMLPTPSATVYGFASPSRRTASHSWPDTDAFRARPTPSSWPSWLSPITMAAADVKPLITAWDRKFTTKPARSTPSTSCTTPVISASTAASTMYSPVPGSASADTPLSVSSATMATGPTASCREDPKNAYTSSGTVLAYKPATGGRPASMAYAIPCGTSITATVTPAETSPVRSRRW
jgi:hypothetical protein